MVFPATTNDLGSKRRSTHKIPEARRVAYGEVGEQLDMLSPELQEQEVIAADPASTLSTVKSTIPRDST